MKNLAKILLVLAFSTSAFAGSTAVMPNPGDVTTTWVGQQSEAQQQAWINSLTSDQYNMLSSDVQAWVQQNASAPQQQALGITQQ